MLHTDVTALKKAHDLISASGKRAEITQYFWIEAENKEDDIFCYFVLPEGSSIERFPGTEFPLFKRNGEMTDFILPIPS